MTSTGISMTLDFFECDSATINHMEHCFKSMVDAAKKAHMTVLGTVDHAFSPQGLSICLLLSESHLTMHSWPEEGKVSVDCFTCGNTAKPLEIIDVLHAAFSAKEYRYQITKRGIK